MRGLIHPPIEPAFSEDPLICCMRGGFAHELAIKRKRTCRLFFFPERSCLARSSLLIKKGMRGEKEEDLGIKEPPLGGSAPSAIDCPSFID